MCMCTDLLLLLHLESVLLSYIFLFVNCFGLYFFLFISSHAFPSTNLVLIYFVTIFLVNAMEIFNLHFIL